MAPYEIRIIGDPVLRQRAAEVTQVDAALARLCDDMLHTMYEAPARLAPPVWVSKATLRLRLRSGGRCAVNRDVESRRSWV